MRVFRHRAQKEHKGAVPISDLFLAYKARLRPPQGVVITAFCAAVEAELGVPLARTSVRYSVQTRTLSIQAAGPHKSEILFRKQKILAACTDVVGKESVPLHIV